MGMSKHYSEGRRWSDHHKAWVFPENWTAQDDVAALREALVDLRGWVIHWQADVAGNLKPTPDSLESARIRIEAALRDIGTW